MQLCTATRVKLNQLCTWTAKTHAIPSLHRDNFKAKVPGFCLVLRQVTLTNYTAGPLAVSRAAVCIIRLQNENPYKNMLHKQH